MVLIWSSMLCSHVFSLTECLFCRDRWQTACVHYCCRMPHVFCHPYALRKYTLTICRTRWFSLYFPTFTLFFQKDCQEGIRAISRRSYFSTLPISSQHQRGSWKRWRRCQWLKPSTLEPSTTFHFNKIWQVNYLRGLIHLRGDNQTGPLYNHVTISVKRFA